MCTPPLRNSAIHHAVRAEWVRQVGAAAFDADMTWSEAGGDSLKALELIFKLESCLRRPVPMVLLKPNTRPNELIASLEHRTTNLSPVHGADQMFDPFASIRAGTDIHREQHGCFAFPFSDGATLGVLAGAVEAKRILELGTGLGYTALWLAYGASAAQIDTIELDPQHVRIARENFSACGYSDRIRVYQGGFATVMPSLLPGYDLAFFDGFGPTLDVFTQLSRLLRSGGLLISSNLTIGSQAAEVRAELIKSERWLTAFALESGRTAISLRAHGLPSHLSRT